MTDDTIELTRRKILGGVGAVGVAGAAAGLGSSAFFSDQETFVNNQLVAGELDMKIAATHHYVDWLPDTAGPDAPDPPQETNDAAMPNGGDADLRLLADQDGGADTVESDIELAINGNIGSGSVVNTVNGGASSSISCGYQGRRWASPDRLS